LLGFTPRRQQRGIGIILENHPQGLLADARTIASFLDTEGYASIPVIYDVANAFAIDEDPVAGLATLWSRLGSFICRIARAVSGAMTDRAGAIDFPPLPPSLMTGASRALSSSKFCRCPLHGLATACEVANERARIPGNDQTSQLKSSRPATAAAQRNGKSI